MILKNNIEIEIAAVCANIKKLTNPLTFIDIGNICLGKYTFFKIFPLATTLPVPV